MKLKIKEVLGICNVGKETLLLSEIVGNYGPPKKVLDMGCGTGYIAIYLSKSGFDVDAVDISERAVNNCKHNANMNDVSINVFKSDLFDKIEDKKYDIIIFNVPIDNSTMQTRMYFKTILRKLKYLRRILLKLGDSLYSSSRRKLIAKFLEQAKHHINKGGEILMHLADNDCLFFNSKGFSFEQVCSTEKDIFGIYRLSF